MSKARGITYAEIPNPGSTEISGYNPSTTYRGYVDPAGGGAATRLYIYSDYTGWDSDPDLISIHIQGNTYNAILLPATIAGQIREQSMSSFGTSVVLGADFTAGYAAAMTTLRADCDYIESHWPGVPWTITAHSAGGDYAAHLAEEYGVPFLSIEGHLDWTTADLNGAPWTTVETNARVNAGITEPVAPEYNSWPLSPSSPERYIIHHDDDDKVHADVATAHIAACKNLGVYCRYDLISEAAAAAHTPWEKVNMDGVRDWFDHLRATL